MPNVSIALIKQSNKLLSNGAKKPAATRSSKLSHNAINGLMQKAFGRLSS
ncbi:MULTISPECIES: hypothetical protein [Pseudomonas]|nr:MULTISPECIES: hypothetical protein [Pseudomonas]MBS9759841.1 hypothetical protein [Pseudomonas mosselii]